MATIKTARPGISFILGILAFCLVGALVVLVRSNMTAGKTYDEQRAVTRKAKLAALRVLEERKLTTYAWTDKAKGVVQVPIGRAVDLTLQDLKNQTVAATTVKAEANTSNIAPPYLQTAPAAAPAATPAPAPAATAK